MRHKPNQPLRRGWTTGACATAATCAAYTALLTGEFPDPVAIHLPKGRSAAFALTIEELGAMEGLSPAYARAGIVKDAGDDPDVTHGALVMSTVRFGPPGDGIRFLAGPGVGTITKPGLPLAVGEPAINPVPRQLMSDVIVQLSREHGQAGDVTVEISVPDGEALAAKTWNPRLGIVGGISILGTTGVVVPYSCSAWIHSIHRGVDVARASGLPHVAGCTGNTSERAARARFNLPEVAILDMGDFAGGLLKYLNRHPLPRLTIAGGFAKLVKLACGHMDLHSGRSQVDFHWLASRMEDLGADPEAVSTTRDANTAAEVLQIAGSLKSALARSVANAAAAVAQSKLSDQTKVDVMVVDRSGAMVGVSDHD